MPALLVVIVGFCVPLGILLAYSFWPTRDTVIEVGRWTLENYGQFFTDPTYWQTLLRSFLFVGVAAAATVVISFPFAYFVALRVSPRRRKWWIIAAVLPFSTSYLIRIFAWLNLFGDAGILNKTLLRLHLIGVPLGVLEYGRPAVVITFVYLLFPLSFLIVYVAVERIDPAVLEAAADLGAPPWRILGHVVMPIARTGLLTGFAFCFVSMMGDYVTPSLMGGTRATLFATFVVSKFGFSAQWGFGSALAFILLASMLVVLVIARRAVGTSASTGQFTRHQVRRRSISLRIYSLFFMVVLYLPIGLVVLFAFNSSDLIGLPISGLTLHWFTVVFQDPALLDAWHTSLAVVAVALPLSLVLGTAAAVQLARGGGRWRSLRIGVLALPIFLPPVMLGLGVIISLNALGITRGLWTIIFCHALLILPVVIFMVLARLEGLDPNLDAAAMDLGARPWRVLLLISVPQAFPAILAAALIGFAMSLDEFIVTYLVTGHDITLPLFIYSSLHYDPTPELNALSTLMLAGSFLLCGVAALLQRTWRGPRRTDHDR
jgi:spermidine/putrescine transport system permease protein